MYTLHSGFFLRNLKRLVCEGKVGIVLMFTKNCFPPFFTLNCVAFILVSSTTAHTLLYIIGLLPHLPYSLVATLKSVCYQAWDILAVSGVSLYTH